MARVGRVAGVTRGVFGRLQVGIGCGVKEGDVDVRNVVLVLRGGHELFPGGIGAEVLPVLFAGGHMGAGDDAGVEDGIETESLEEWDLAAFVEHLNFIGKVFLCRAFITAELVDPVGAWSLQSGGDGMVGHIGEGQQEDGLYSGIGCIVKGGFDIVFSDSGILCVPCQGFVHVEPLFDAFERNEDIDVADGGRVIVECFEDAHFGDAHSVEGGYEGGLQVSVDPGFLVCCFQGIDAEGVVFLFGGGGGEQW